MKALRPFFYFYGSKWKAAPLYPAPRYRRIVEPFAGSAGYSGLYPDRDIILVERDPIIAELWRWLIKVPEAEVLALPLEIPTTVRDLGLAPGPSALIGFWITAASAAPCQTPNSRMRSGRRIHSFWGETIRARVAAQVSAIRHWTLIEGDFADAPQEAATYFVDPPYAEAGKHYRVKFMDFERLATMCRMWHGQVIVCENDGATWLPFTPFREVQANNHPAGKEGKAGKSVEAIWLSDEQGCEEWDATLEREEAA